VVAKFVDAPEVKTVGAELGFVLALKRAEAMLAFGMAKCDAMQELIREGVQADIAYFAVIGATVRV